MRMSAHSPNAARDEAGHPLVPVLREAPHLSLVPPIDSDGELAVVSDRPRRQIAGLAGLAAGLVVVIGVVVLPGDTQSPAPVDQEYEPKQPADPTNKRPAPPDTVGPVVLRPPTELGPGDPQTPVPAPTPETPPGPTTPTPAPTPTSAPVSPRPVPAPDPPPGPQSPSAPTNPPPAPADPPPPVTAGGTVHGCDTYGSNCEDNPLYVDVPPQGYDWRTWPKVSTVANGTTLTARCWARGGITYNYAVLFDPPDYGPDPYESDVYFNVRVGGDQWAWIPDTYFVRDKNGRMGLSQC